MDPNSTEIEPEVVAPEVVDTAPAETEITAPENTEVDPLVEAAASTENVEGAEAPPPAEWDKFTYKVREEEKEFEEWIRPLVKDEDTYKKVQDLYTARDGIGIAKQERDDVQGKFDNLNESLETVNRFVQAGDARSFIKSLNLPKKMFIDYAIEELKYQELAPEERAQVDSDNQGRLRMHQLEMQNENLQRQFEETARNNRLRELDTGLNGPDVLPLIQDYDARVGRQGAFKQAAIERGIFHSQVNGVDMGAQDVINDAINYLGLRAVGTTNQHNVQAGTQGHQVHPASKPVIPNIQGRGTSPVGKKAPTSIDDIRRIRAELMAQHS